MQARVQSFFATGLFHLRFEEADNARECRSKGRVFERRRTEIKNTIKFRVITEISNEKYAVPYHFLARDKVSAEIAAPEHNKTPRHRDF